MNSFNNLSEVLLKNNITPSVQRIKILEYLVTRKNHPTADQLYHDLKKVHSLSKATVYNTLALLAEKGIVKVLTLENNENRYDIIMGDHGHFLCDVCKKVYDFSMDLDRLAAQGLDGFEITDKNVCFKGICPECLSNKK